MTENRPYLNFKAIKARAVITSVLDRYGVQLKRVNQTTLKGNCPLPSHSSKSKDTFYVSEAKSAWYCHSDSCKKDGNRAGGNVIDFVSAMESISVYAAAERVSQMFPPAAGMAERSAPVSLGSADHEKQDESLNKALGFTLKDINPEHPMIQGRGISVEIAKLFGIGFFPGKGTMAGRIVFALYEDGELIGYAGRTILPVTEANPKWLIGKGVKKTFVYGLERCDPAKPLLLLESFWGPPFFYEKGIQAAALMGSELTEAQERRVEPFKVIRVAFDNDDAGKEKAARVIERLKGKHVVLKARLIE